ncbi:alpha/beta hydrolase [Pseudomonas sp. H9]|uniref:alpha/beta hydrolase n=1 Tax=Pseudomonas sp. H9 TaxID=483968 RepID=UPI001057DFEF|nr:alpha/beta hydrolase [Pseudomonas sp. H9]TDF82582.1 alpha/beta hydrolase [Pseudomonas sp. H9]
MPLHPDIEGFLELVELGRLTGKSQPMHALTPQEARRQFDSTSLLLDSAPAGQLEVTQLVIPSRDGQQLAARCYQRAVAEQALRPVLMYFHGGGYVVGSLDSHDTLCRRLALAGDFVVISADYRLAPEHKFPTAFNDAEDVALWVLAEGAKHGLDATRVALAGDSVGGSLVAALAIQAALAPEQLPLQPRVQVLLYPVLDAAVERASLERFADGYLLEKDSLRWFYQLYERERGDRLDWRFSPIYAPFPSNLAPTVLWLAEFDPLLDEGLAYAERVRSAGLEITCEVKAGMTHDFARMGEVVAEVPGMLVALAGLIGERLRG